LIDRGGTVDLRLLDTPAQSERMTRRGVARLYGLAQRKSIRAQMRWLPRWDEVCLWASSVLSSEALKDQVGLRIAELAFVGREGIPRSQDEFNARLTNGVERIGIAAQELAPVLPRVFEGFQQARVAVADLNGSRCAAARQDIEAQLAALFEPEFLTNVPWTWLLQYPRYLAAIVYRADKLKSAGQAREDEALRVVADAWNRYLRQHHSNEQRHRYDPNLVEYRWMIEEFRVSLFAQPLGTSIRISPQRLDKQWAQVERG
jgi:ATP-dependent helicase HrpA